MSNAADNAYAAWPERLYIIDETGHIVYRGGLGPFHYKPAEVRQWLAAKYGAVKQDRKSTRLNSSHGYISYAVFCLKKKTIASPDRCTREHSPHERIGETATQT